MADAPLPPAPSPPPPPSSSPPPPSSLLSPTTTHTVPSPIPSTALSAAASDAGALPLAPQTLWRPPEGCSWAPVPAGKRRSWVYAYFVAEYDNTGEPVAGVFLCVHKDHHGLPTRVAHANGTTNLRRHLKDKHGIEGETLLRLAARLGRVADVSAQSRQTSRRFSQPPWHPTRRPIRPNNDSTRSSWIWSSPRCPPRASLTTRRTCL